MIYRGITYFKFLQHTWIYKIWKKCFCPKGIHLWDEVYVDSSSNDGHYLVCDACNLDVLIKSKEKGEE